MAPRTRYARLGDDHVAYQIVGDGPIDLVFACYWWSHLEEQWNHPLLASFLERLATFSRLILFDKRGTGLSDPITGSLPTLEHWMDDIRVVMDAASSEQAAVFAHGGGSPLAMTYAAIHPERVKSLVLCDAWCRQTKASDFPLGYPPEAADALVERCVSGWGSGNLLEVVAPSLAGNRALREWYGRFQRLSTSPGVAATMWRYLLQVDVRPVLSSIQAPTLVLHRRGDRIVHFEHARYLADRIRGARLVELPGDDHMHWAGDSDRLLDEVQEFVTGQRAETHPTRALCTLLFTDLVSSTDHAHRLGDRRWRSLLDQHDMVVREELRHFQGREVNTTGDGFLATFDGPNRALQCAQRIRARAHDDLGVEVRIGVHAGECELRGDDLAGIGVHIAARVMGAAGAQQIVVSRTVRDLVAGSASRFQDLGRHSLKGIPEDWDLYLLEST